MPVPTAILELVERFDLNRAAYHAGRYNEAQVRQEFINPLFAALGWDVYNTQGYSEKYKEVVHEDALQVGEQSKAPDYAFRLGGQRVFFVEAKKPAVHIKTDVSPAYQLRRYAWSAKLPVSILTDFEEFAVYDCRIKPVKTDQAATARVMYLTYRDYAEQWDDLAALFSPEAIRKGALDRYVESKKAKKGTAEVDAAFLAEIEGWREVLARNLALRNPGLTVRELNRAVQMTIDRLIFLRICEDRGIEPYGRLRDTVRAAPAAEAYAQLGALFRQADDRYNSGLFYFKPEPGREQEPDDFTLRLSLDDKVLKPIVSGMYYPDSPYEFSVLPADILGQVYEQFLGKVIRLTPGGRARVEEKPEVKKAGGVYYTPTYIVDYIVAHTVGRLLETKTPRQVWGSARTAPLRVLDPACGSGTFLLQAYQYLLDWYLEQYLADDPELHARQGRLVQDAHGDWILTPDERKRVLLTHIHGVDIDPQAVEVTKLSLLLKVLEGDGGGARQISFAEERALPDLERNIRCGNSLIGPDYYKGRQLAFDEEEMYRVNAFDWKENFPQAWAAGGFDAVIGNPPYIRIQRVEHDVADYVFEKYRTPTSKTDLSLVFLEQALSLTTKTGLVGFICTSQWLATDYGRNMRRLLSDGKLREMVDFGSLPVFVRADTYPAIFILSPTPADHLALKRIQQPDQLNLEAIENAQVLTIELSALSEAPWNLGQLDIPSVLHQRNLDFAPLKTFGQAYIGLLTGMDKAFVVDRDSASQRGLEDQLLLPYAYRGAEVRRYSEVQPQARVIYPYLESPDGSPQLISETDLKSSYPNIYRHLLSYKDALRRRKDSRKLYAEGLDWYRHLRPGSFDYIRPSKFIIKGIDTRTTIGLLGENTAFNGANCPGFILKDLRGHSPLYILGILNSKVISYYLRMVCPAKLGGYSRFNANNINNTPIRLIQLSVSADVARHERMVALVETMLELHEKLAAAKTPQARRLLQQQIEIADRQIDALVYELYGLTEDEIAIVEGA